MSLALLPAAAAPNARESFLLSLGTALHRAGIPAHRMELALGRLGEHLGLETQLFSTPTSLTISFGPAGQQRTGMVRVSPSDLHLSRLTRLDAVGDALLAGELDVVGASAEVERIARAPQRFGPVAVTLATSLVSASASTFFGAGPHEAGVAGLLGLALGLLALMAGRAPALGRLYLPLASATAAAGAALAAWLLPGLSAHVLTLSALIVLVPGLTLTVAMNELATSHLVSGTARAMAAGMVFLQMGLGVALGSHVGSLLPEVLPASSLPGLPSWSLWPATGLAGLCLVVLFQAELRDTAWIVASTLVAMAGATLGAALLEPPGGAFIGALAVGAFGSAYARLTRRPALVVVVPGILLLVPGAVGFEAISAMLASEVLTAVETGFHAALAAVALAAGLLVANAALPARRSL